MANNKRNIQFFRNSATISDFANHQLALEAADIKLQAIAQNPGLLDGEIVLYRYTITGNTQVHTIVGVVCANDDGKHIEILGNYDILNGKINGLHTTITSETATAISNAIKDLDGDATIATVTDGVVTLKAGITQTDGTVSQGSGSDITLSKVATTGSYNDLSDKPTIPVVNDGKLTIKQGTTTLGEFTANQSTGTTIDIPVPTEQVQSDWNETNASSKSFILNKPNVATLDSNGKIPTSQLPSYVDDVVEYANSEAFPQPGESGKIYMDASSGDIYRWTGSQYLQISGIIGAQGEKGEQGIQGFQGFQGTTGLQGFQGYQGKSGVDGAQGEKGEQGIQGFQGFQGFQGETGIQGTTGLQGFQGYQGKSGVDGAQGEKGEQGIQGFQGETGTQGYQGYQGFQGYQGYQGKSGIDGLQGATGIQGLQGFQGLQGSALTVVNNDKILTQTGTNVSSTLSLTYDSTNKLIKLLGVNNTEISSFSTTDFIKDGMLESAELVTNPTGQPAGDYIKLTFNTDAGKNPIYINVTDLVDVYTAKQVSGNYERKYIDIDNNNVISHILVTPTTINVAATNIVLNGDSNENTITVPYLTFDNAGHIKNKGTESFNIKLETTDTIESVIQPEEPKGWVYKGEITNSDDVNKLAVGDIVDWALISPETGTTKQIYYSYSYAGEEHEEYIDVTDTWANLSFHTDQKVGYCINNRNPIAIAYQHQLPSNTRINVITSESELSDVRNRIITAINEYPNKSYRYWRIEESENVIVFGGNNLTTSTAVAEAISLSSELTFKELKKLELQIDEVDSKNFVGDATINISTDKENSHNINITHKTSGVTAGTKGSVSGTTITVPVITVNEYGHVTALTENEYTVTYPTSSVVAGNGIAVTPSTSGNNTAYTVGVKLNSNTNDMLTVDGNGLNLNSTWDCGEYL